MAQYSGNDNFPASAELVNDGTVRDAASVNVLVEAALDRTTFLRNVGFRRVVTWVYDTDLVAGSWTFEAATFPAYAPTTTNPTTDWLVLMPNTRVGDILQIDVNGDALVGAATTTRFRVGVTDNFGSGSEVVARGCCDVTANDHGPVFISTSHVVAAAGTSRVRLLAGRSGSGTSALRYYGMLRVGLLRPSGSST